jgi:hypothetical protein
MAAFRKRGRRSRPFASEEELDAALAACALKDDELGRLPS